MAKDKTSFMEFLSPKKDGAVAPSTAQAPRSIREQELPGTDVASMVEKQTDMIERVLANSKSANPALAKGDLKALSGILEGLARKTVVVIFAMGKVLTEVKAVLPHGDFIPWVEENCMFSRMTAFRYMAVYDRYKDEPRRALEELTIAEAYIEAGVKKLMAPSEDEKIKTAGGDRMSTDGLPLIDDYKHFFKRPPASGIDLKRYRVFTHTDGAIYGVNLEMGMIPICNLYVNNAIDNSDYKTAVAKVHQDVCLAAEAYYYRVEQLEDAGLMPKPADLRMGSMMRKERNITQQKKGDGKPPSKRGKK